MVTSRMGEPTPQRAGRPKRFFAVTANGVSAIARAQRAFQKLMNGISIPILNSAQRRETVCTLGVAHA